MAQVESAATTSPKARLPSSHQKECSTAIAYSKRCRATGVQDTGNSTCPNRPIWCSCSWAESTPGRTAVAARRSDRAVRLTVVILRKVEYGTTDWKENGRHPEGKAAACIMDTWSQASRHSAREAYAWFRP